MIFDEYLDRIQEALKFELPGHRAHAELAPLGRKSVEEAMAEADNPRMSAVLAVAYPVGGETYFCFIQRRDYKGVHSGQIAFPGGKKEEDDPDLVHTAIRETEEEVGLELGPENLLGELSPLYIPPSNFYVQPYLAHVTERPDFVPDPMEVQDILEISLRDLLDEDNLVDADVEVGGTSFRIRTKAFQIEEHIIWGATAMMVAELRYMLRAVSL